MNKKQTITISVIILSLFLLLPGCQQQSTATKPEEATDTQNLETETADSYKNIETDSNKTETNNSGSNEAKSNDLYSYEIKMTADNSSSGSRKVIYKFSRPVFEETSSLAKIINNIYMKKEKDFVNDMNEAGDSVPKEALSDPEYPHHHTELTECTYEKDGIVSFVTNGDWFMGGVHNSWKTGHTFDFVLGRELKITDILLGNESQIKAALEKEFYKWFSSDIGKPKLTLNDIKKEYLDDMEIEGISKQSGADANFYLADDGVHIFYEPYTISATQNGVDILIPWTRTELIRPLRKP